jgi:hypothetical protein
MICVLTCSRPAKELNSNPRQIPLLEDVVVVAALVVAAVAMVVSLVVAVAPMMAQSKGAHAKNPARSARKQATMPGTIGTAMMMMMSTKTSLQGLLLRDMALTPTGMQTVVLLTISPANWRR